MDINGVGLYTLGKYRKNLSDSQKKQYEELFKNYFLKSFSNRLVGYSDAKIAVLSEEIKNEKYTIVELKKKNLVLLLLITTIMLKLFLKI